MSWPAADDEEFGEERLAGALLETAALSVDACADHILSVLQVWCNQYRSSDDGVTLVIADFVTD